MGAYGVITQGQNSADVNGIGGVGISGISKRPARVRKLPAKFKDAPIGNRSVQASKIRRNMAITDDEDKVQPQKKKPKTRLLVDTEPNTDTDQVSLNEGHREKNTTSEDAQDTCANTDVSSNWDDLGKASIEEANTSDAMGCGSDEEEWEFSQLDKMATKDAQVQWAQKPLQCLRVLD